MKVVFNFKVLYVVGNNSRQKSILITIFLIKLQIRRARARLRWYLIIRSDECAHTKRV